VPEHEGEIALDENTFEGAAWISDPSLVGAMFRPKEAKHGATSAGHQHAHHVRV
jgi:hypothetical protein